MILIFFACVFMVLSAVAFMLMVVGIRPSNPSGSLLMFILGVCFGGAGVLFLILKLLFNRVV